MKTIAKFLVITYLAGFTSYLILRTLFGNTFGPLAIINTFALLIFLPFPIILLLSLVTRKRWLVYWSLSIGLLITTWFIPYYWPKSKIISSGPTLRIVTCNCMGWHGLQPKIILWLQQQNADIIFLQEIPRKWAEQGGSVEFKDFYPYQITQPLEQRWAGTGLLSNYPILSVEYKFSYQRIIIDYHGQSIALYNVHFTQPTNASDGSIIQKILTYDDAGHKAQVTTLLTDITQEELPFIVAGDFNMSDQSPTYPEIAASMQDSFLEAGFGLGLTWPLKNWEERNSIPEWMPLLLRMDYIWHGPHFHTIEIAIGPKLGSDHLPLYATLEITNGK